MTLFVRARAHPGQQPVYSETRRKDRLHHPIPVRMRHAEEGALGALVIIGYDVISTVESEPSSGRVHAAYKGIFVILSLLWGESLMASEPNRWDLKGYPTRSLSKPSSMSRYVD